MSEVEDDHLGDGQHRPPDAELIGWNLVHARSASEAGAEGGSGSKCKLGQVPVARLINQGRGSRRIRLKDGGTEDQRNCVGAWTATSCTGDKGSCVDG